MLDKCRGLSRKKSIDIERAWYGAKERPCVRCAVESLYEYKKSARASRASLSAPRARDSIVALCAPFFLDLALRARSCALRIHLSIGFM